MKDILSWGIDELSMEESTTGSAVKGHQWSGNVLKGGTGV
tara:strand:+ start:418 stop:537 length:120 start_codon:yes stop_codon:yes gene_type:complete